MKLSMFLVLLPSVSAFVMPSRVLPSSSSYFAMKTSVELPSSQATAGPLLMVAKDDSQTWSIPKMLREMTGSSVETKTKADSTATAAYAELRKKVLVKQQRQSLEGQLCSLIRIEGNSMSCKAEKHVRRLASDLEALQENAAAFGMQRTGLAGSWKLIYASDRCDGSRGSKHTDELRSVEEISYVSENYRLVHADHGVLRVYKRVASSPRAVAAAASGSNRKEDDTFVGAGNSKAGRASATAAGRTRKVPLRKRMFFGWRR